MVALLEVIHTMELLALVVLGLIVSLSQELLAPKKKEEKPKTAEQELLEAIAKYEEKKGSGKKTEIVYKVNDRE